MMTMLAHSQSILVHIHTFIQTRLCIHRAYRKKKKKNRMNVIEAKERERRREYSTQNKIRNKNYTTRMLNVAGQMMKTLYFLILCIECRRFDVKMNVIQVLLFKNTHTHTHIANAASLSYSF